MMEFRLGKLAIPYSLHRSENATRLHVEMSLLGMRVTAPSNVEDDQINAALHGKRRWIVESYADLQSKYDAMHKIARFRTGAKLPYWGRLAGLKTEVGANVRVSYRNGLHVELPLQDTTEKHDDLVEAALRDWLRQRLTEEAKRFCRLYGTRLGVQSKTCRVSALKTRWGSCGANGVVTLDWHLVFGPKRVLEYVVAHELGHMVERNHSKAFWLKLRSVFGDYEREHEWLMRNEHMLGYTRVPIIDQNTNC